MPTQTTGVNVQVRSRAAYFRFNGNLGPSSISPPSVVAEAARTHGKLAILDLTGLESLDSDGIEMLERIVAFSEGKGVKIRVVAPRKSKVRRVLELVRFDRFLFIAANLLEALRFDRKQRLAEMKKAPGEA